ncbi:MAG: hypothetical protein HFH87_07165 [Lachnospiraceae bacterium]|nr:hypothetical protein [Lachnospiraceae bacterium]
MVDLKEKEMFESDMLAAVSREMPYFAECKRIISEQQRYIRSLVEENEKLREHILDTIINC